jgi:aerobic-type carbon monoxide dehydrogenase small subunit (CoxS/CutS family)
MALCGACIVHIDGAATRSCITSVDSIGASAITTIEAIGATPAGAAIQETWLDKEVVQCRYCQSGQITSVSALIASNPRPTDSDIDDAMSGNICRCKLSKTSIALEASSMASGILMKLAAAEKPPRDVGGLKHCALGW